MRVKLEDVCERGSSNLKQSDVCEMKGDYPIYGASGYIGNVDFYHQEKPYVAVVKDGAGIGRTTLHPAKSSVIGTMQYLLPKENVLPEYLFYVVSYMHLEKYFTGATIPHIYFKDYKNEEFNLDSIEKQAEIVDVLGRCQQVIEKRKREMQLLDDLIKARFVEMFGDVQHEEKYKGIPLRNLCTTMSGGTPSTKFPEYYEGDIPWISTVSLGPNHINGLTAKGYITQEAIENSATKLIPAGNILFGTRVGVGKSSLNDVDICTNQDIVAIIGIDESRFKRLFIKYVLDAYQPYYDSIKKGATILGITGDDLKDTLIPDVPLSIQMEFELFVAQVDKSKVAVQKALDETQMLFDSLMQKYFM